MADAVAVAADYDALHGGAHGSLDDIHKLGTSRKLLLPTTMTHATQTIKCHMLLLDVMLGSDHPLAIHWQELFMAWECKVMFLETFCATLDMPA
jgi:hypothetical protein